MRQMNEDPIRFNGYNLDFYETTYAFDDTKAIICEADGGMPYATVTINLGDWGIPMATDEVALNHDLSPEFKEMFVREFGTGNRRPVAYGYAVSEIVQLKGCE